MTNPLPPELFARERPVRSDFGRERSYALRRILTLCVLAAMIFGGVYVLWHRHASDPAFIPTIKADGAYKQKPTDPGGIDIPHQDVRVYDELEGKNALPVTQVEHLLPPAEIPQDVPHASAVVVPPPSAPTPVAAPVAVVTPVATPAPPQKDVLGLVPTAAKPVNTTVTPQAVPEAHVIVAVPAAPVSAAAAPSAPPLTIDQVLAETKGETVAAAVPAKPAAASGNIAVQLASVPDQAKAQEMAASLQEKYTAQLGAAQLHATRADLGSRGVFYRIQSQNLSEDEANHICSALKNMNAGCILVRK